MLTHEAANRPVLLHPLSDATYLLGLGDSPGHSSTSMSIINPANGTATTIAGPTGLDTVVGQVVVSPDSRYAYLTTRDYGTNTGTVSIFSPATGTATVFRTGTAYVDDVVASPDGRYAYVTTQDSLTTSSVWVIDPAAGTATTIHMGMNVARVVVSPDSRYAYALTLSGDVNGILVINPVTGTATTTPVGHTGALVSNKLVIGPDSRYAYVTNIDFEYGPNGTSHTIETVSVVNPVTGTATAVLEQ